MSSAICLNLDQSKILSSGNRLKVEWCGKGLMHYLDALPYFGSTRDIFVQLWTIIMGGDHSFKCKKIEDVNKFQPMS